MTLQSVNPATGAGRQAYEPMDDGVVQGIVEEANAAFLQWKSLAFEQRGQALRSAGRLLRAQAQPLARLMAEEMGKP
ncbi:MAG TPA: aldehyde dehydrogenase family protein, partial [Ramlibacter sp.]|nr:aldehyde dehydrogenase family protein [Ramlibacter sp.]